MYTKKMGDTPFNQNSVHDGCIPFSSAVATHCEYCSGRKVHHPFSSLYTVTRRDGGWLNCIKNQI